MSESLFDKQKFNINLVNSQSANCNNIDRATYTRIEKLVKDQITDVKGTDIEITKHNEMLAKCVIGDKMAQTQIKFIIKQIIERSNMVSTNEINYLVEEVYRNNYGLGAIDDLISDDSINEIWVNGYNHIWVEQAGITKRLNRSFKSDEEVIRVIRQILQFDKESITLLKPVVESKMLDGSRTTFAIPPVALRPTINIRRFKGFNPTEETLIEGKTISKEMVDMLKILVRRRANILIIGETSGGKTSILKFLCDYINPDLRLGTIESNFELKLSERYPNRNIFEYEEHEEVGATLGNLFKLSLRSSPDIIILGEARGSKEAEQLINAMRRGHPGSIGTIHTNSPETTIDDLIEMILEDGKKRDPLLLEHRIANAVQIIIQTHKFEETGKRKIVKITEVIPLDRNNGEQYYLNDLFIYNVQNNKFEKTGTIKGEKLRKQMLFYGLNEEENKVLVA